MRQRPIDGANGCDWLAAVLARLGWPGAERVRRFLVLGAGGRRESADHRQSCRLSQELAARAAAVAVFHWHNPADEKKTLSHALLVRLPQSPGNGQLFLPLHIRTADRCSTG